ncbi:Golgi-associated plant pathogenesis-related protein 1-like [Dermacentor silvarum]|uniref:Golgi-associated plant pathogenesis-related protein 1-like n=1 Tax=Dermacentor silvarum TaxID=543639 RepID=UPI001899C62B|nr:Golgi-associated plant pathogenesis-related protein 1-like [Dermacentor silvarum]
MNPLAVFILCLSAYALAQKTKTKVHSGGGNEPTVFYGEFTDYMRKVQHQSRLRHNYYRRLHGVPDLKDSEELSNYAQAWAEQLAKTGQFRHRSRSPYGENIYMSYSSDPNVKVNGSVPVDSWYSEIMFHNYNSDNFNPKTGHFTQVIWKGSRWLGTGVARSPDGKVFVVSNYKPRGNMMGQFRNNCPRPKSGGEMQQRKYSGVKM